MSKQGLDCLDCNDKTVLMRVDFSVPLLTNGEIADDTRIQSSLPSISCLLEKGARLVLLSHMGRPKGKEESSLSLRVCAKRLQELLPSTSVHFSPHWKGRELQQDVANLQRGEVLLFENVRFHPAEESSELAEDYAKELAALGDAFVNDAFATAHRKNASTYYLAKHFPDRAFCGKLMEKEAHFLKESFDHPKRPFVALIGGAKVSSKLGVLHALVEKADALAIGGGMAFTFLKAQGKEIGNSLCEEDLIPTAKEILEAADKKGTKLILPEDVVAVPSFEHIEQAELFSTNEGIPSDYLGVDIGPLTLKTFSAVLKEAKLVFWNGPLGVTEISAFAKGTQAVGELLGKSCATTVVGGGDSVAAIKSLGLDREITHVSTGGGASLKLIERGSLPALEVLSEREPSTLKA